MSDPVTALSPLIARVWPRLVALVARLATLAAQAGATGDCGLRLQAFRLLRPAEALARRIIMRLAEEIDAGDLQALRASPARAASPRPAHRAACSFCLFEPVPTFAACFGLSKGRGRFRAAPRILDLDAPSPCPAPAPAPATADTLTGRVEALQRVLDAPDRSARRLARRIARTLAAPASDRRITPLRPGWPPGLRSLDTPEWLKAVLLDLNHELRSRPPPGIIKQVA